MAKSTTTAAAQPATPSEESLALVAAAIAGITGCGIAPARVRAGKLSEKDITRIADLEKAGKRDKIPSVLSSIPSTSKATAKK